MCSDRKELLKRDLPVLKLKWVGTRKCAHISPNDRFVKVPTMLCCRTLGIGSVIEILLSLWSLNDHPSFFSDLSPSGEEKAKEKSKGKKPSSRVLLLPHYAESFCGTCSSNFTFSFSGLFCPWIENGMNTQCLLLHTVVKRRFLFQKSLVYHNKSLILILAICAKKKSY